MLAWTAADMMVHDLEIFYRTRWASGVDVAFPRWAAWTVRISILVLCLTTKWWWPDGRAKPAEDAVDESAHSLERVLDQAPVVFDASAPEPVAAAQSPGTAQVSQGSMNSDHQESWQPGSTRFHCPRRGELIHQAGTGARREIDDGGE